MKIPYIKLPLSDIKAYIGNFSDEKVGKIFKIIMDYSLYKKWSKCPNYDEAVAMPEFIFIKKIVEKEIKNYKKFCKVQKQNAKKLWKKNQNYDEAVAMPPRQCQTKQETKQELYITTKEKSTKKESPSFLKFWEVYPKARVGSKEKAAIAFQNALKRHPKLSPDDIIAAAVNYSKSREGTGQYVKGAAAWLNDDRFLINYSELEACGQNNIQGVFGRVMSNISTKQAAKKENEENARINYENNN